MEIADALQFAFVLIAVIGCAPPLSAYLHKVFTGQATVIHPALAPVERAIYRISGIDDTGEMTWVKYTFAVLLFSAISVVALGVLLLAQGILPGNPAHAPGMSLAAAFNVAVAFATNTDWQIYAGEKGVSGLVQAVGLTWQNFVSAGAGMAVSVALVRGLTRRGMRTVGNFWVDLTRSCLYVLLPLSFVFSVVLMGQGVVQDFGAPLSVRTIDSATQTIPRGLVASQEAIKVLGTNGGGFFNANSAHPFENPTPLTNALQIIAILLLPAALALMVGRFADDLRQGWVLLAAMAILFTVGVSVIYGLELGGNPLLRNAGASDTGSVSALGNMEGKEVRFGIAGSALFTNATTAASCGAVNSSHDSLMPMSGGIAMLNIALGEVIFGGVGSGLYGMLVFALIAVFIAGLMVGRTPEYLGKKIGPGEMKLAMFALLALEAGILVTVGLAVAWPSAASATLNQGPHALTEILYGVTSAVGNNGSAMGGLNAAAPFYVNALAIAMLIGRYLFIVPVLGIAGAMAAKRTAPPSSGTFPTDGPLFVGLLVGVIVIVGALTFFPAYALGPVLEQLLVGTGRLF